MRTPPKCYFAGQETLVPTIALAGLLALIPLRAQEQSPVIVPFDPPPIATLRAITVPSYKVENVSLDDAVNLLVKLTLSSDKKLTFKIIPPADGLPMPKVSLAIGKQLPMVTDVLEKICDAAQFTYDVENNVVTLKPGVRKALVEMRSFDLSQTTFSHLFPPQIAKAGTSDKEDFLMKYLIAAGVDFPYGTKLAYVSGKVYAINTPAALGKGGGDYCSCSKSSG